ncbi:MAG: hypothetical protein GTN76_05370 [Candidatus Aenigmarchaeota archaeon]|nr:hypothetical protein [Candidatus Aenigmarchaeota archaeon]
MDKSISAFLVFLILIMMPVVQGQQCVSGDTRPCGSDIGVCETGLRTCKGGEWSDCIGEKKPTSNVDVCDNGLDDNCDGTIDEDCFDVNVTCYNNEHDLGEEGRDCGGKCPNKCLIFPWVELMLVGIAVLFLGLGIYYMQREKGKRVIMSESITKD